MNGIKLIKAGCCSSTYFLSTSAKGNETIPSFISLKQQTFILLPANLIGLKELSDNAALKRNQNRHLLISPHSQE